MLIIYRQEHFLVPAVGRQFSVALLPGRMAVKNTQPGGRR